MQPVKMQHICLSTDKAARQYKLYNIREMFGFTGVLFDTQINVILHWRKCHKDELLYTFLS